MADTTAGLMIKSSMLILMLSTVGAEKLRHRSSPLYELHQRFSYPRSELKKHSYQTVAEDNFYRRHPNLFRVRNKVTQPKTTTTSSSVAAVIMLPWFQTTEDPFRMDRNGTLDDSAMPDVTVKSGESLEWENGIDNEWDVFNKKQTAFTSTSAVTPSTHHHHHHHSTAATAITSTHQRVHEIPVKLKSEDLKARRMEEQKIMEHINRVTKEAKCKLPRPKVIRISDVYPHSSKKYNPHCTIIHQCGSDTGCCDDERKVCSAAKSERVYLSFYILDGRNRSMERLEFLNHTECHCLLRKERLLQDSTLQPPKQTLPPAAPLCACPGKYSVRHLTDGTCMCDCFHLDKSCLKLKKGKAIFSIKDVKCIQNGTCLLPSCEYGHYLQKSHRCVQRDEMFSHWPKFTVQDIDS